MSKLYIYYNADGKEISRTVTDDGGLKDPRFTEVSQAFFDSVPVPEPVLTYRNRRARMYPSVGDQLDALWTGGTDAEEMRQKILAVKAKYPKDVGQMK